MRLIVEIYDEETECIATVVCFEVNQIEELLPLLCLEEFYPQATYELERSDIQRINERFNLNIDTDASLVKLRGEMATDDLPYQIHTNRELALMLAGEKPLSVFAESLPPSSEVEEIPERLFDPYVATGRFIKKEYIEPVQAGSEVMIRRVLYAFPTEYWRINAYILLLETAKKSGWSEGFERMEGSLLGYTDQQNEAYIDFMRTQTMARQRKPESDEPGRIDPT